MVYLQFYPEKFSELPDLPFLVFHKILDTHHECVQFPYHIEYCHRLQNAPVLLETPMRNDLHDIHLRQ